jgi:hypothetical protein
MCIGHKHPRVGEASAETPSPEPLPPHATANAATLPTTNPLKFNMVVPRPKFLTGAMGFNPINDIRQGKPQRPHRVEAEHCRGPASGVSPCTWKLALYREALRASTQMRPSASFVSLCPPPTEDHRRHLRAHGRRLYRPGSASEPVAATSRLTQRERYW